MHTFYESICENLGNALLNTSEHKWLDAKIDLESARNDIAKHAGKKDLTISVSQLVQMCNYWQTVTGITNLITDAHHFYLSQQNVNFDDLPLFEEDQF